MFNENTMYVIRYTYIYTYILKAAATVSIYDFKKHNNNMSTEQNTERSEATGGGVGDGKFRRNRARVQEFLQRRPHD